MNNVGIGSSDLISSTTKKTFDSCIVNCVPQALLSRIFIPRFINREKQSAIINVSSIASYAPDSNVEIYGATKAFNRNLSLNCGEAYSQNGIDFFAIKPGYVITDMTKDIVDKLIPGIVISPEQCAQGIMKSIGQIDEGFGGHGLFGML